jgi:hypothetical protein
MSDNTAFVLVMLILFGPFVIIPVVAMLKGDGGRKNQRS